MKKELHVNFKDGETKLDVPTIALVLENGEELVEEIEKAQHLIGELSKSLNRLGNYNPKFRCQ